MKVDSGNPLRIVREFIQSHAINGSDVTWGSNDVLRLSGVTVNDMEELAQRIKDVVLKENAAAIRLSLWPQSRETKMVGWTTCGHCDSPSEHAMHTHIAEVESKLDTQEKEHAEEIAAAAKAQHQMEDHARSLQSRLDAARKYCEEVIGRDSSTDAWRRGAACAAANVLLQMEKQ